MSVPSSILVIRVATPSLTAAEKCWLGALTEFVTQ